MQAVFGAIFPLEVSDNSSIACWLLLPVEVLKSCKAEQKREPGLGANVAKSDLYKEGEVPWHPNPTLNCIKKAASRQINP